MCDWAKARRERTRHLIELGGLVQKAGLVELVDDDRGTSSAPSYTSPTSSVAPKTPATTPIISSPAGAAVASKPSTPIKTTRQ